MINFFLVTPQRPGGFGYRGKRWRVGENDIEMVNGVIISLYKVSYVWTYQASNISATNLSLGMLVRARRSLAALNRSTDCSAQEMTFKAGRKNPCESMKVTELAMNPDTKPTVQITTLRSTCFITLSAQRFSVDSKFRHRYVASRMKNIDLDMGSIKKSIILHTTFPSSLILVDTASHFN